MGSYQDIARRLRPLIEKAAESLQDEDALEAVELYPAWSGEGVHYVAGQRVRDEGILYSVLQDHDSQAGWKPADAPSLFARVLIPDPDVIPDWVQPDSTNPYMRGDKVRHNSKVWESLIDNNVWEPGAIGTESLWREVTGNE